MSETISENIVGHFFVYGQEETDYLKSKDKRLKAVIDQIGHVNRTCMDDLFESIVNSVIGQQISTKAHVSIWTHMKEDLGKIDAETILTIGRDRLQAYGTSWRKADYITEFAEKVHDGSFDLKAVYGMTDEDAIAALTSLKGVGVWTAEMMLLFCLQRPNILSYGDLAIQRGMRMVYRHKELPKERFERYRRRLSPYCSVASLYFWAVAGGAIPGLTDPAAQRKKKG